MTQILALTKYGRAGPSSRVRTYQFLSYLEEAGFKICVSPLFTDDYIHRLYGSGQRNKFQIVSSYINRLSMVLNPLRHDVVWVEKEVFPYLPTLFERGVTGRFGPMVVDYDDAIFHHYDLSRRPLVRALLGRKIDAVMKRSALVVAGNSYLRDRAVQAGARRVEILPSVVDVTAYAPAKSRGDGPVTVGWIGSPVTAPYLEVIRAPLAELQAGRRAEITLIGADPKALAPLAVNRLAWSEARQGADLAGLDIGVMPLDDTPWERGKCGYKIIQYMAAGLPVVASDVGANRDIVEAGVTGFLAGDADQWRDALGRLAADPALRRRMGEAGRAAAVARFSTQAAGPRLVELLQSVGGR